MDEANPEIKNGKLLKKYLQKLKKEKVNKVFAIVWCITEEGRAIQMLQDQAAAIKNLELPLTEVGEEEEGEQETGHSIWDNVIIVCKKGVSPKDDSEKKSFQGAMSAVDTLESGKLMRAGDKMKCLAYTLAAPGLQGTSEGEARSQLLTALLQIAQPVKCNFRKEVTCDGTYDAISTAGVP